VKDGIAIALVRYPR